MSTHTLETTVSPNDKKFSPWQLLGVGGIAAAIIAGLGLWLSYSREPELIYDRTDVSIPAPPGQAASLPLTFVRVQFHNVGKRPANVLQLSVFASQPIIAFDWFPKLSGMDEFRPLLSADRKGLDLSADRFPAGVKLTLLLWLTEKGSVEDPRFSSQEFSSAEKVASVDLALIPWYKKKGVVAIVLLGLIYAAIAGTAKWWLELLFRLWLRITGRS